MTLEAALEERNMKASELIRRSGVSAPTIYNITSPNKEPYKTGVKADTLAKIAETLNAIIVIDANKPFLFDIILKEGKKMRTVKGTVLTMFGIVAAIVAVGCGDSINGCESTAQMFGWVFISLALLATALVLCALGVNAENEQADTERLKRLNRVPTHTNEWRDAQ